MTNRLDFEKVRTRSITNQNPVENERSVGVGQGISLGNQYGSDTNT